MARRPRRPSSRGKTSMPKRTSTRRKPTRRSSSRSRSREQTIKIVLEAPRTSSPALPSDAGHIPEFALPQAPKKRRF